MSEVERLIASFGGWTEEFTLYNGRYTFRFDKIEHKYFMVDELGDMQPVNNVSSVCHIIDKSKALVPWACKMMQQKLLSTIPTTITKASGVEAVILKRSEFVDLLEKAKTAHKDHLEDAGDVGKAAHNWIELYIQKILSGDEEAVRIHRGQLPLEERAASCVTAALEWMEKHNVRWLATEQKVYSAEHNYIGTLDGKAVTDSCGSPECCPVEFKNRVSLIDWKTSNYLYVEYILQVSAYDHAEREEHGTKFEDYWIIRLGKEDAKFDPWHLHQLLMHSAFNAFLSCLDLVRKVVVVEDFLAGHKAVVAELKKKRKEKEKAERLAIACEGSKVYKGVRAPRCNGGNPCQSCLKKFAEEEQKRCELRLTKNLQKTPLTSGLSPVLLRACTSQETEKTSMDTLLPSLTNKETYPSTQLDAQLLSLLSYLQNSGKATDVVLPNGGDRQRVTAPGILRPAEGELAGCGNSSDDNSAV